MKSIKSKTENLIREIYSKLERLFLPLIPLIDRLLKVSASLIKACLLPPTRAVLREAAWSH